MGKRILLGIDFIGANFPSALYAIQQWLGYATRSEEYDCMLGVSNFCDKHSPLPGATGLSPSNAMKALSAFIPKDHLAHWTSEIDATLLAEIRENECRSQPFFPDFSYGSVVNRLLLLAYSYDCDYLVRIDPGTLPPEGRTFAQLMCEHEAEIDGNPNTVVSRRYANRLALRDMFVKPGKETSHAELVTSFTGIDVHAQITGGAMLTLRSPGTPAVCFPAGAGSTLVWASDDGIYQVLSRTQSKSRMLPDHPVQRFDAVGKHKESTEYYRGIVGAVYLNVVRTGKSREVANQAAERFVDQLKGNILDVQKCRELDNDPAWTATFCRENKAPGPFLDAIAAGYENHVELLGEWERICGILKSPLARETSANKRIDTDGE